MTSGKIAQIVGPVIDVEFDSESGLPKIYDSLEIDKADGSKLVLEVQAHIGENMVRTIAMDSSDGLSRGAKVIATDNPIKMPIGKEINGATAWYQLGGFSFQPSEFAKPITALALAKYLSDMNSNLKRIKIQ